MQKNTKPNKRRFSAGEGTHCSEREAERIEKPFGAWPSVIGIHHRACNSCEAFADRTKEKMAAKAFLFLPIAVTEAILASK